LKKRDLTRKTLRTNEVFLITPPFVKFLFEIITCGHADEPEIKHNIEILRDSEGDCIKSLEILYED
jgi:hypothetical protein